ACAQPAERLRGQAQPSAAPGQGTTTPAGPGGGAGAQPGATTTSSDVGRQLADAQFNATLQGFNQASRGAAPAPGPASPAQPKKDKDEEEPGFLGKITRA